MNIRSVFSSRLKNGQLGKGSTWLELFGWLIENRTLRGNVALLRGYFRFGIDFIQESCL